MAIGEQRFEPSAIIRLRSLNQQQRRAGGIVIASGFAGLRLVVAALVAAISPFQDLESVCTAGTRWLPRSRQTRAGFARLLSELNWIEHAMRRRLPPTISCPQLIGGKLSAAGWCNHDSSMHDNSTHDSSRHTALADSRGARKSKIVQNTRCRTDAHAHVAIRPNPGQTSTKLVFEKVSSFSKRTRTPGHYHTTPY